MVEPRRSRNCRPMSIPPVESLGPRMAWLLGTDVSGRSIVTVTFISPTRRRVTHIAQHAFTMPVVCELPLQTLALLDRSTWLRAIEAKDRAGRHRYGVPRRKIGHPPDSARELRSYDRPTSEKRAGDR